MAGALKKKKAQSCKLGFVLCAVRCVYLGGVAAAAISQIQAGGDGDPNQGRAIFALDRPLAHSACITTADYGKTNGVQLCSVMDK
jgi:hypothetical protein